MSKNLKFIVLSAIFVSVLLTLFLITKKDLPTKQINEGNAANTAANDNQVPLPQQEDVIRVFFSLMDEGRIPEALAMMSDKEVGDESQKQAWGVHLNAFENVTVTSITKSSENTYQVNFNATMKPESADEVIPYFGYDTGENIRWIELEKVEKTWKILGIATGP